MNERFADLLAKGKTGELIPAEREELARLLNLPILDPLDNPPAVFLSKHQMVETDGVARLQRIEWFVHCGEPGAFDLTMEVERATDWDGAMRQCMSPSWEAQLSKRGTN